MRHVLILLAVFAVGTPGPATAAATDWSEIGPGSRMRLISEDLLAADGTTRIGIEIELASATRTYWRVPGETGLPLRLDLQGSAGVTGFEISWPFPRREVSDGYIDYAYYDRVVLPVTLTTGRGATGLDIRAALELGVCAEICIPARAEFSLRITFGDTDRASAFRLDAAMADVPASGDGATAPFGGVTAAPDRNAIVVAARGESGVGASLIVHAEDPSWLFGLPQNGPHSGLLELPVLAGGEAFDLVGKVLRLIYMTDRGPYELTRVVGQ